MKAVSTTNAPAAIGPYVQGMIVNGMFYSSGQIPLTPAGEVVEGSITEQTAQVFANLEAVLNRSRLFFISSSKDISLFKRYE